MAQSDGLVRLTKLCLLTADGHLINGARGHEHELARSQQLPTALPKKILRLLLRRFSQGI